MDNDYLQGACCFFVRDDILFGFYTVHDKYSTYIEEEVQLMNFNDEIKMKNNPIIIIPFFKYEIYDMKNKLIQLFMKNQE